MFVEFESNNSLNSKEQTKKIETEMQSRPGLYPMQTLSSSLYEFLESVLTKAFISQPILGNVILSSNLREKIHRMAEGILLNAVCCTHIKNYGLDDLHCDILVLETVLLLRNWSDDENNADNDDANFWEYICNQYALTYDYNFGNSHEYKIFRYAIARSLTRHKRLLVKVGQRYYTTMLTHALAPKVKFYALFEQIFGFYAKTLNYQYVKADPAFRAFAYAMKNRFESGRLRPDDSVYIKSVQSSSAIKALFLNCPEYMSAFVEYVVYTIDVLVATGNIRETSYLDTLLVNWHNNRSKEERSFAKHARSKCHRHNKNVHFRRRKLSRYQI